MAILSVARYQEKRGEGRGVRGREVDGMDGVVEGREEERMPKGDDDDVGPKGDPAIESA